MDELARGFLDNVQGYFTLTDEQLRAIVLHFLTAFRNGLAQDGEAMAMVPSHVVNLPNGSEVWRAMTLGLSGPTLSISLVELLGEGKCLVDQEAYGIPGHLKSGTAEELFDWIADTVSRFLGDLDQDLSDDEALNVGFTFSFPFTQTALNNGNLLHWTKGFAVKGMMGRDIVRLLQDAFDRQDLHIRCTALLNDSVATLISHAYQSGGCLVSGMFDVGTSGAFSIDMRDVPKLKGSQAKGDRMVFTSEWGSFDNARNVLPITMFDNMLDRESGSPRQQTFEKMVSAIYLGELTRNVLLYLVDNIILFRGYSTQELNRHGSLDYQWMQAVKTNPRLACTTRLGFSNEFVTDQDVEIVQWACDLVSTRAALLSGCALAAALQLAGAEKENNNIEIGISGCVAQSPGFEEGVRHVLSTVLPDIEPRVNFGLVENGSCIGAALCRVP